MKEPGENLKQMKQQETTRKEDERMHKRRKRITREVNDLQKEEI